MKYIVKDADNKNFFMECPGAPVLPQEWILVGKADDLPQLVEAMSSMASKEAEIQVAYDLMNKEVLDQMAVVFGTTNPDSASAYEKTWGMMKETPGDWIALGLKNDIGHLMDTEEEILAYAEAKLAAVLQYGKFRMQRIQQFRNQRQAILDA